MSEYIKLEDAIEAAMSEYIKLEDAIEAAKHTYSKVLEPSQYLKIIPAADVAPVRHAHWIYHRDNLFPSDSTQECSYCHKEESLTLHNDNYCPNCGAKMDEVSE